MSATTKKKSKQRIRAYEHIENIEPVATKEFVRQEISAVKKDVNRLWQVMLVGFVLLASIMIYLHSDTKQNIQSMRVELKQDMQTMENRIKTELKKDMQIQKAEIIQAIEKNK